MVLQVLGDVLDAGAHDGHLDLWATGVSGLTLVRLTDLFAFVDRHTHDQAIYVQSKSDQSLLAAFSGPTARGDPANKRTILPPKPNRENGFLTAISQASSDGSGPSWRTRRSSR